MGGGGGQVTRLSGGHKPRPNPKACASLAQPEFGAGRRGWPLGSLESRSGGETPGAEKFR